MGYLDNSVEYGFGQLGSGHVQLAASTLTPPSGLVIVAISFVSLQADSDHGIIAYYGR